MAFAGVSLVGGDGKLCASTVSPIDSRADSGYHLLLVEGFSRTRDILPPGEYVRCRTFFVGGRRWHVRYYPNGYDSELAGFIALALIREEDEDDENDQDWEAGEDDVTDNDDEDEDDDYVDDEDEDDHCEDEYHEDQHNNNDEAHDDDMAEEDDCEDEAHDDDMAEHDYDELFRSVKARVSFCFIDQFQWLHSGRETKIVKDFGLSLRLIFTGFMRREMVERSAHLKDDSFTIRCDVVVLDVKSDIKSKQGSGTMVPAFIQVPPSDMPIHFKDLLLSKEGADVTFVVGHETLAAHRCILAARSTVFKSQLLGDAIVKIDDIEAHVFKGMLTFIYTDTIPWNNLRCYSEEAPDADYASPDYVTSLLQLLEAAERYDLPRLKLICKEQLVSRIHLETVVDIIVGAERGRCPWLKEQCLEFIKSHTSLNEVFTAKGFELMTKTCTPSVLKDLLLKLAS